MSFAQLERCPNSMCLQLCVLQIQKKCGGFDTLKVYIFTDRKNVLRTSYLFIQFIKHLVSFPLVLILQCSENHYGLNTLLRKVEICVQL